MNSILVNDWIDGQVERDDGVTTGTGSKGSGISAGGVVVGTIEGIGFTFAEGMIDGFGEYIEYIEYEYGGGITTIGRSSIK